MDKKSRHVIRDLRSGRNGYDPPWAISDTESADAVNVDLYKTTFANKRGGMAAATVTGMSLAGVVSSIYRHVPSTNEANAEFWAVDDSATPVIDRLAGGTTWAAPTLKDAPTGNGWDVEFASINAKLAAAYKSAQNRLHFWDGATVRRGGLIAPAAPTGADFGSGSSGVVIAFDATATGSGVSSSVTFAHTCGGTNRLLFVLAGSNATDSVVGVTYNAVSLTKFGSSVQNAANGAWISMWYLIAPASGSHNIVVAANAVVTLDCSSASYKGCLQSGVPDASGGGATATLSITTVTDGAWTIMGQIVNVSTPSAGAGTTTRQTTANGNYLGDSNAAISPPGSTTLATSGGSVESGIILAFAPLPSTFVASSLRYYRTRWTRQSAGITIGRSEPGVSLSFSPSGTGTAVRVTQPPLANEGETHWELEASTDNTTFYRLATMAIATTTYDDAAATTSYNSNPISALTGVYTLQKPYKFVAADQNRLLGFGSWNASDKQSRMEFSAVIGSLDIGDEERVDTTTNYFLDFDENDSGSPTGLLGPVLGSYIAFKQRQVAQLTPTGSIGQPYRQDFISKSIGATNQEGITRGEDANGNPALYWMSYNGPYRWGVRGLEYLGRNMEDYIVGGNATINLSATKRIAVTVYYPDKRQVWFFWATGTSNDPNVGAIFDVKNGGFTRIPSGDLLSSVRCAALFSSTIGASMSRDLKPYVGQTGGVKHLCKCDTGTDDLGTPFRAYVITRAEDPGGSGYDGEIGNPVLLAKASQGVTITDTIIADYGLQTTTGRGSLSPAQNETRISVPLLGAGLSGVTTVQHQIGDAIPISNTWTLDQLVTPFTRRGASSS